MSKKRLTIKMLAEGGLMIALSILLSNIKLYQAPMGGSVTVGSMVPLIFFAMRWGVGPGIFVGSVFGILKLIMGPWFVHPVQVLLDYPVPYGLLGLAGITRINGAKDMDKTDYIKIVLAVLLAIGGRMFAHLLAGVIFYKDAAIDAGMGPWVYSIIYNGQYLIPEFIISSIILVLLWKPLSRIKK